MKRNYLLLIAVLFVCAVALAIAPTAHYSKERSTPVFTTRKIERKIPQLP